jgi:hypothetical protein
MDLTIYNNSNFDIEVEDEFDENSVSNFPTDNTFNTQEELSYKAKTDLSKNNNKADNEQLSLENEPFYFESDTLALRNNPDYSCLLKTLILLEAQRVKACQDLEKLIDMKEKALNSPVEFVNSLKNNTKKEEEFLPNRQKVYVLPEIDWNKYYECVDLEDLEQIKNQKLNRVQSLRQTQKLVQNNTNTTAAESPRSTRGASLRRSAAESPQQSKQYKKGQQHNYNKSWSVEEQRTLEELLIEFPPEDNEAARWRKIATKLGTRTPLQVQSHCQKYFIKLAKAGLPIPGRMPNMKTYVTKKSSSRGGRKGGCSGPGRGGGVLIGQMNANSKRMVGRGSSLNEISSMWTSFNPPITMDDDDHDFDEDENSFMENKSNYDELTSQNSENFEDFEEEEEETEDGEDEYGGNNCGQYQDFDYEATNDSNSNANYNNNNSPIQNKDKNNNKNACLSSNFANNSFT